MTAELDDYYDIDDPIEALLRLQWSGRHLTNTPGIGVTEEWPFGAPPKGRWTREDLDRLVELGIERHQCSLDENWIGPCLQCDEEGGRYPTLGHRLAKEGQR